MTFRERFHYYFHRKKASIAIRRRKGWSGLSILILPEDMTRHPIRFRVNYYVLFFLLLVITSLPLAMAAVKIGQSFRKKDPNEILASRRQLLTGLKLVIDEKSELLDTAKTHINQFHRLAENTSTFFMKEGNLPEVQREHELESSMDSVSRGLQEVYKLGDAGAYIENNVPYALGLIWTRMSIHSIMPKGRPLQSGYGTVTSTYGYRIDPFGRSDKAAFHSGVDFAGELATPILATADGVVMQAAPIELHGYGLYVRIHHGLGYNSLYAHCSKLLVSPNDRIKKGQVIALLGSTGWATGNHLHYEVRLGSAEPIDPMEYLQLK